MRGFAGRFGAVVFFDAAFLLFHLVVFPQGNFSFDLRTQRLTQRFHDQFWPETSIGIAAVGLAIAVAVTLIARRQAARLPADLLMSGAAGSLDRRPTGHLRNLSVRPATRGRRRLMPWITSSRGSSV